MGFTKLDNGVVWTERTPEEIEAAKEELSNPSLPKTEPVAMPGNIKDALVRHARDATISSNKLMSSNTILLSSTATKP